MLEAVLVGKDNLDGYALLDFDEVAGRVVLGDNRVLRPGGTRQGLYPAAVGDPGHGIDPDGHGHPFGDVAGLGLLVVGDDPHPAALDERQQGLPRLDELPLLYGLLRGHVVARGGDYRVRRFSSAKCWAARATSTLV